MMNAKRSAALLVGLGITVLSASAVLSQEKRFTASSLP